jgi:bla regulator protein blaR1
MERRMVEERERACDEAVVELGNDTQTYAESILKVCQFYVETKLACVAGVSGSSLKKRIEVIMRNPVMEQLSAAKKLLLAVASAMVIVVPMAVGLTRAPAAVAQATADAAATPLTFDTVKIVKTAMAGHGQWIKMKPDGTFGTTHMPLRGIIAIAYGVDKSLVIGGADWLDQSLYDIRARTATAPAKPSGENPSPLSPALKALLATRFGLVAHPETRQLSAYVLRVAASGSKLNKAQEDPMGDPDPDHSAPRYMTVRPNLVMAAGTPLTDLTKVLTTLLGRPVVDETGLNGRYDFALTGTLNAETLATLLREQLGLTVEATTEPVDVIVIDDVQQPLLDTPPTPAT